MGTGPVILTVTLDPAVDKLIRVRRLVPGTIEPVREKHLDPAGKGINVSRVVDRLGAATLAFGFLAGEIGTLIARALAAAGIPSRFLFVPGHTRLNVTIFDEATGQGTSFRERGPRIRGAALTRLEREIQRWLTCGPVLVLSGSLPPGVPADVYSRWISVARDAGVRSILDADGAPLRQGIAAHPYLIKPNRAEAERLLSRSLPDETAVVAAAREIQASGVEVVVISLGAAGAVCAANGQVWRAVPPIVRRRSTVGSGDSLVAGLAIAIAQGRPIVDGLRLGTAAGAATAMSPGTALATSADVARLLPEVRVEPLDGTTSPVVRLASRTSGGAGRR